jgi:Rrf2 family protein
MISKKTINAIEVCVFLAGRRNVGYVTTTELSPRLDLSISYLENILKLLKDHKIVTSMKGPGGGYMIQGDVSCISMWDIALVFEQTLDGALPDHADKRSKPASYERDLEHVIKDTLSNFTLSDFADTSSAVMKSYAQEMGRFHFKPLAAPFMPKAPNSVFQLHMTF